MTKDIPGLVDCRKILGDKAVVISGNTVLVALRAIEEVRNQGGFRRLYTDDASFLAASIIELEAAHLATFGMSYELIKPSSR